MRPHVNGVCLCCLEREGVVSRGVLRYLRLQWLCKPNSTQEWGREGMGGEGEALLHTVSTD